MPAPRTSPGFARRVLVISALLLVATPAMAAGWLPSVANLTDLAFTALLLGQATGNAEALPIAPSLVHEDASTMTPGLVAPPDPAMLGEPETTESLSGTGGVGDDSAGPWPQR